MITRDSWRAQVLPALRGDVLDVGAGQGHALPYLTGCTSVTCFEPRPSRQLRAAAAAHGARLDAATAERLPYPDRSFDAAVCSAVLCSVADQERALAELARVLRPDGALVFFEHVGSPRGTWWRHAERALAPLSRLFDHGCDPSRDTLAALERAYTIDRLERWSVAGPFGYAAHMITGTAMPAPAPTPTTAPSARRPTPHTR